MIDGLQIVQEIGELEDPHAILTEAVIRIIDAELPRGKGAEVKRRQNRRGAEFEAFIRPRFGDLPGPVAVDIWIGLPASSSRVFGTLALGRAKAESCLFVTLQTVSEMIRRQLESNYFPGRTTEVWDAKDLAIKFETHADTLVDILTIPRLAVGTVVTQSINSEQDEWKVDRDGFIASLREAYHRDDLVLFLGAGVSLSAGLPSWNSLLYGLLTAMIEYKIPTDLGITESEMATITSGLQALQGASPLLEARYIRAGLEEQFTATLSKLLYRSINDVTIPRSPLLGSLARLCMPRRGALGIRAVVTFNFDDLLEEHLKAAGQSYRPISRDEDIAARGELSIFHVHGFLPRDGGSSKLEVPAPIVFSEEQYHNLYSDPFSWSNIVQLNFMREHTCVLVGLSLSDPNLRRLLDTSARKAARARHYVVLKRLLVSELVDSVPGIELLRPIALEQFLAVHHGLLEVSLRELNLNVVWVESHVEIPALLDQLREVIN